jgi:hypothetical protein
MRLVVLDVCFWSCRSALNLDVGVAGWGNCGEQHRITRKWANCWGPITPFRRPYGRFRFVVSKPRDAIPQDIHEARAWRGQVNDEMELQRNKRVRRLYWDKGWEKVNRADAARNGKTVPQHPAE